MRIAVAILLFLSFLTTHAVGLERANKAPAIAGESIAASVLGTVADQTMIDMIEPRQSETLRSISTDACKQQADCLFLIPISDFATWPGVAAWAPETGGYAHAPLVWRTLRPPIA